MSEKQRWMIVVLYAAAMAWVESAVVYYLRVLVNRLDPYQPNPLPAMAGLVPVELVREAATLIMLFTVGWLAGRTWRNRLAYMMIAFGAWDIMYYVFLAPISGWPRSLLDWDILFLLPLPWWGPVLAPVCIAVLMIVFGTLVSQCGQPERALWPGRAAWGLGLGGATLALYVFMADAIQAVGGGAEAIRNALPIRFNWPLFALALALMTAPVIDVSRQYWSRR
jgi:hypothetical protein